MLQCFTNLLYHIVFPTKDCERLITPIYEPRIYEYITSTISRADGMLLSINGAEDHVHVLARLSPEHALTDILRDLKWNASGWMPGIFPEVRDFSWEQGYADFTVNELDLEGLRQYLQCQKEYHQYVSFKQELIELLQANGLECGEQ